MPKCKDCGTIMYESEEECSEGEDFDDSNYNEYNEYYYDCPKCGHRFQISDFTKTYTDKDLL
jgi:uncharacterized OB-fold protein